MDVINCKICGKIFSHLPGASKICPDCREKEEEDFKIVKEYIYDHPGSSIYIVSQETGISVEKITRFLKEERLELVSDEQNVGFIKCERCGKAIATGRFCLSCKENLERDMKREVNEATVKKPLSDSQAMFVKYQDRKK